MTMNSAKGYMVATYLLKRSPYHKYWTDWDYELLIVPPVENETFVCDFKDGLPSMFATYAFPDEGHVEEYLETGRFPPDGFYGIGNTPWIIDFICLGGKRDIISGFRYLKDKFIDMGYDNAQWLRTTKHKRGWHKLKGV